MNMKMNVAIQVRCLSENRKLIQQAAMADNRSVSAWCRLVLVQAAEKQLKEKRQG